MYMKVFFDTNILMDYATNRLDTKTAIEKAFDKVKSGYYVGYCAFHGIVTVEYLLKKAGNNEKNVLAYIKEITNLLVLVWWNNKTVNLAVSMMCVKDFEDMCIYLLALENNCDVIITENKKDFASVKDIEILTAKEFYGKYI